MLSDAKVFAEELINAIGWEAHTATIIAAVPAILLYLRVITSKAPTWSEERRDAFQRLYLFIRIRDQFMKVPAVAYVQLGDLGNATESQVKQGNLEALRAIDIIYSLRPFLILVEHMSRIGLMAIFGSVVIIVLFEDRVAIYIVLVNLMLLIVIAVQQYLIRAKVRIDRVVGQSQIIVDGLVASGKRDWAKEVRRVMDS